jgi:Ca2+-binding EF-hand superfamily protein
MYVDGGSNNLSWAELQQMRTQRFQAADTNGSGGLTLDEMLQSAGQNSPTGKNGPSIEDIFGQMDTDGSGEVTQAEMEAFEPPAPPMATDTASALLQAQEESSSGSNFASQILSDLDTDDDGALSLDEFLAGAPDAESGDEASLAGAEALFNQIDTDGDGSLTEDELAASTPPAAPPAGGAEGAGGGGGSSAASEEEDYDPLDTNEDGVVSQAEREAAYPWMAVSSEEDETSEDALLEALDESDEEEEANTASTLAAQDQKAVDARVRRTMDAYGAAASGFGGFGGAAAMFA